MAELIKVEYRRDGTVYSGKITREEPAQEVHEKLFHGWEFREIVRAVHLELLKVKHDKLVWVREDVAPYKPYWHDHAMVELIRNDPVAAIRAMSPPDVQIRLSDLPPTAKAVRKPEAHDTEPDELRVSLLRVGHDTLADAFGEWVYASYSPRRATLECLGCGRWAQVFSGPDNLCLVECSSCGFGCGVELVSNRWGRVATTALVGGPPRHQFFVPRAWNQPGPWILAEDLAARYEMFRKEKESCFQHSNEA